MIYIHEITQGKSTIILFLEGEIALSYIRIKLSNSYV